MTSRSSPSLSNAGQPLLRRPPQRLGAVANNAITVAAASGPIRVMLGIVADEDDPHALLVAHDAAGAPLARVRVALDYRLSSARASAWIDDGFCGPA